MYLKHFGVREYPFSITPDTSFHFLSSGAGEALNTLLIAVRTGEGFIKITGEVGTGKTVLCRRLMASLEAEYQLAYIPNPYLEPRALFREIAYELGLEPERTAGLDQHDLLREITERLVQIIVGGKKVLICLDEAQAMPIETLEALRLLSNLETEKRKLIQVVIFGQPELEDKLNHPSIRQFKQRIAFEYRLQALAGSELGAYVQFRLAVAGYNGPELFSAAAIWLLGRCTQRVPRLVNIMAHKSMLAAFGKGKHRVSLFDVLVAANDTPSVRWLPWRGQAGIAAFCLACGGFAGFAWAYLK